MTDEKQARKVRRPEKPEKQSEDLYKREQGFFPSKDQTEIQLAIWMTKVLIGILIANTVVTITITFLTGFKVNEFNLPTENFFTYLASTVIITAITSFIIKLLKEK